MTIERHGNFPIVALGGSAGGLDAFFSFFQALERLDDPPGMAFVVILHLPPDEKSHLAELLANRTSLAVKTVSETTEIKPDTVYVMPPDRVLAAQDGALELRERKETSRHHPVDELVSSLAHEFGERTVAIICSGTGSNGSANLGAVREAGGCVIAQEPETAEYDEMPLRAIDTGFVDVVRAPDAMPDALLRNAERLRRAVSGEGETPRADEEKTRPPESEGGATEQDKSGGEPIKRILALLRARTSNDFRPYKRSTLYRRIDRRAHMQRKKDWAAYADLLQQMPEEVEALASDLLITVTSFFRDAEAWQTLSERIIQPMVAGRSPDDTLRVWTAGCATGEEAYSIAIALFGARRRADASFQIEIFATDASEKALSRAREGRYPAAAVQHLPQEWVERWFDTDEETVRVKPVLREVMIFAPHNLLGDPPFSRADLVICRNVLIYLEPEIQKRLIGLFHFALKEGGHLFLGSAESAGGSDDLFQTVDKTARLFRRTGATRHDLAEFPVMRLRAGPGIGKKNEAPWRPVPRRGQVTEQAMKALVDRHAPPAVLVDHRLDVIYYHGATDRFLKIRPGEATHNLLALARDSLSPHLRRIIEAAKQSGTIETAKLRVSLEGERIRLRLEAMPISGGNGEGAVLVSLLEEAKASGPHEVALPTTSREQELEEENRLLRDEIASTARSANRSEEEYKAYNEEITSMNEELRVSNEELETSKEELQSLNEELSTVNSQLHAKVTELNETTADLQNLLQSTDIATLFLDSDLNVRLFSPQVEPLFRIRDADIGRPISHLVRQFADEKLEDECHRVLRTLQPAEAQVHNGNRILSRRITPYRALDDRIAGVVLTFADVTEIEAARRYAERIVETVPTPLLVLDLDLRVRSANPAFYQVFSVCLEETENRLIYELGNGQWNIPVLRRLLGEILPDNEAFDNYEVEHEFERIGRKTMLLNGRRLDHVQLILVTIEDITAQRRSEDQQSMLMAELGHRVKNALGVVQGMANQTLRRSDSLEQFRSAFLGRLNAYARSHTQLLMRDWQEGNLRDVMSGAIEAHGIDPQRLRFDGPRLNLATKQALALGLIVHELETNAIKYGALSGAEGQVEVSWSLDEKKTVIWQWRESGGPETATPQKEGFGTTLLRELASYDLGGNAEVTYESQGLRCTLTFPASRSAASDPTP